MALNLPIPQNIDSGLYKLLAEICRRAADSTVPSTVVFSNTVTNGDIIVATAGYGLVLTTRDGTKTFRLIIDNDGNLAVDRLT